jgi:hypothetical protein
MSDSIGALIADMARAGVDPDLIGRTAQMLAGSQLDGYLLAGVGAALGVTVTGDVTASRVTSQASPSVTDVTVVTLSKGALRQRRYRERLRLAAGQSANQAGLRALQGNSAEIPEGSDVIAAASPMSVTSVTAVTPLPAAGEGTPLKGVHPPAAAARRKPDQGQGKRGKWQNRKQRELPLMRKIEGGGLDRRWLKAGDPLLAEVEAVSGSLPRDRNGGWSVPLDMVAAAESRLRDRATGPPMQATG